MTVSNQENSKAYGLQMMSGTRYGTVTKTLAGNFTVTQDMPTMLLIDPDQARTVTLPAVKKGLFFWLIHQSTGNFDLTISSPVDRAGAAGATTMGTISQNQIGIAISDGITWYVGMMPQT